MEVDIPVVPLNCSYKIVDRFSPRVFRVSTIHESGNTFAVRIHWHDVRVVRGSPSNVPTDVARYYHGKSLHNKGIDVRN